MLLRVYAVGFLLVETLSKPNLMIAVIWRGARTEVRMGSITGVGAVVASSGMRRADGGCSWSTIQGWT